MNTRFLKRTLPAVAMAGGLIMAATGCDQATFDSYAIPALQSSGYINCAAGSINYGTPDRNGHPASVSSNNCTDFEGGLWGVGCDLRESTKNYAGYACMRGGAWAGWSAFYAKVYH